MLGIGIVSVRILHCTKDRVSTHLQMSLMLSQAGSSSSMPDPIPAVTSLQLFSSDSVSDGFSEPRDTPSPSKDSLPWTLGSSLTDSHHSLHAHSSIPRSLAPAKINNKMDSCNLIQIIHSAPTAYLDSGP